MTQTTHFVRTAALVLPMALLANTGFAGGLAEPVAVAQPVVVAAPAPASYDWTGFYAGAQLGYGELDNDALDDDTNGAIFGVHAGYLYDLGSIVLGAEIDYDGTNISSDGPEDGVDLDSVARAKLIAGYDAGVWMPYITAGGARAMTSGDVDGEGDGAFAGLGVSYSMNSSMRLGFEVLGHQFEDFDDTDGLDIDATTATLRVSYVF